MTSTSHATHPYDTFVSSRTYAHHKTSPHLTCSASSMSLQPGGSTEHTAMCLKSVRPGCAMCSSVTCQGREGTHSCTAGVKGLVLMSFSISTTSCVVWTTATRNVLCGNCGSQKLIFKHSRGVKASVCTGMRIHTERALICANNPS